MAKKNIGTVSAISPIPAFMATCADKNGNSNIITISYGGIINAVPPMAYISVRDTRYSYHMLKETGEFVINLTTDRLVWNADFCGVKSGRDTNKFALPGLTAVKASAVSAPMIDESPVNIECRVERSILLGSHEMFIAKIIAVNVNEKLLDAKGVLHLEKAGLAATAHGKYFALGRQVGSFGYSVRKR